MKKILAVLVALMTCGVAFASRRTGSNALGGVALYVIILFIAFIVQFIRFMFNPNKKDYGKEFKTALAMLAIFVVLILISFGFGTDTSTVFDIFYAIILGIPIAIGLAALTQANKKK